MSAGKPLGGALRAARVLALRGAPDTPAGLRLVEIAARGIAETIEEESGLRELVEAVELHLQTNECGPYCTKQLEAALRRVREER